MNKDNHSKSIAYGGTFTALGVLFIYLSTVIPINRLFLLGIASCIIPLAILTISIKYALIVYTSTSVLSFFLVNSKSIAISYIVFFGIYGFIKLYIEKIRKTLLEVVLKLCYFNITVFSLLWLYKSFFTDMVSIDLPFYGLILLLQVIFIIYDYTLTVFINYANKNLVPKISK